MNDSFINYLLSFEGQSFGLSDYALLKCSGVDTVRFLNGQLTNDVEKLDDKAFQQQVRLNRSGQVQAYFYLLRDGEVYYMACKGEFVESLMADLEKFIIMDDVEIKSITKKVTLHLSCGDKSGDDYFLGTWAHRPAYLCLSEAGVDDTSNSLINELSLLGGEPVLGQTINIGQLVTDSLGMLSAVSLQKGCFLGQETVAKIESRRGGAYFPVILDNYKKIKGEDLFIDNKKVGKVIKAVEIDKYSVAVVSLIRNFRVIGKHLNFDDSGSGLVSYLPAWDFSDPHAYAKEIYELAITFFQKGDEDKAINLLNTSLMYKEGYADAYEALGVILGRQGRFEEAIGLMDKLMLADSGSVMAHTNKSLYLMKLGRIEEAEEEKAQATVKSFAGFGKVAQDKKAIEDQVEAEKVELGRRESMFRQVLEIDPEDTLANFGLADIEYKKKNYQVSRDLLSKVLNADAKYSVGYSLMAKNLMALKLKDEAKEILNRGIEVASSNGDLMPANEMQELLNKLV
jgi:folate-binding protein YgfZ